jgi:hypothetical protein
MSSRLGTCPACGKLALHLDLTEEQSAAFYCLLAVEKGYGWQWRFKTLVCSACCLPVISLWPFTDSVADVFAALEMLPPSHRLPPKGEKP